MNKMNTWASSITMNLANALNCFFSVPEKRCKCLSCAISASQRGAEMDRSPAGEHAAIPRRSSSSRGAEWLWPHSQGRSPAFPAPQADRVWEQHRAFSALRHIGKPLARLTKGLIGSRRPEQQLLGFAQSPSTLGNGCPREAPPAPRGTLQHPLLGSTEGSPHPGKATRSISPGS